jgi:hypothetical protein
VAKQHRGWGGKRARAGAPPILSPAEREEVARDYVARVGFAKEHHWQRPYRDRFIREIARENDNISERLVADCLAEFGVGRLRATNLKFLKSRRGKRIQKQIVKMKET